jgi:hypothetical protein
MSILAVRPGRSEGVPSAMYVSLSNGTDHENGLSDGTITLVKSPENLWKNKESQLKDFEHVR